jgi:NAD(P)-dependent dehydrogenase (short-subunit alcohol dehydrogenase family)
VAKNWSTICISGGGSGIGLYFAKKFAAMGAKVVIFDLRISEEVRSERDHLVDELRRVAGERTVQ